MRIKPQFDSVSIVLVGNFNPSIFQPSWFAMHKMLGEKEAETAEISLIHPEASQFKVEQFDIQALSDRFAISSTGTHPEQIKDLVISCFGHFLPHTPVRAMGINRTIHFDAGDFETRDRVGNRLAPKEPWGAWGKEIEAAPPEPNKVRGGMVTIVMRQSLRPDGRPGFVQAKVEPSVRISGDTGIFVDVNDHFDLSGNDNAVQDASSAIAVLEASWEDSLQRSAHIVDQLMALTEECRT